MLNKDKVNEIVADMKEEERKEKLRQKGIADNFLENRLEYYVAMGIKDPSFKGYDDLINSIHSDIKDLVINESIEVQERILKLVRNKVFDGLSKYNLYVFINYLNSGRYFSKKSTGGDFFGIHTYMYDSSHEIHEWLAIEKEKEYLKEVERRDNVVKELVNEINSKEKKESQEWYLIFIFLVIILTAILYLIYAK